MDIDSAISSLREIETDLLAQIGFFIDIVLFHDFLLILAENDNQFNSKRIYLKYFIVNFQEAISVFLKIFLPKIIA